MPLTTQKCLTKRVILFDLGNVLIEWNPYQLFLQFFPDKQAVEHYWSKIDFFRWNLSMDAGRPWDEAEDSLIKQFPENEEVIRAYRQRFLETIGNVKEDVVAILREVKEKGFTVYAASNWNDELFDRTRDRMTFLPLFDGLHISGKIGLVKPDPAFFTSLMQTYAFSPKDAVFIDDTAVNIESAQALGIDAIHFVDAPKLRSALVQRNILD